MEAQIANGSDHRSDYCSFGGQCPTPDVTGRIDQQRRRVAHIAVQVGVAGGEAERVLRGPAAGCPAREVVLPTLKPNGWLQRDELRPFVCDDGTPRARPSPPSPGWSV
jgi:hypothetical protein